MPDKKNQIVKIVLNVNGNDIELSVDNAKELYKTLKVLFEENNPVTVPYPIYPVTVPYPTYPYPEPYYKYITSSSSAKFNEDDVKFC